MLHCSKILSKTLKPKPKSKKLKSKSKPKTLKSTNPKDPFEEDDEAFTLKPSESSTTNHVVQPLGNLYLTSNGHNSRDSGLGDLKILTDELVLEILGFLDGNHLGILGTVSRSLYVFCCHEPIWRNLVLEKFGGGFVFNGSWRGTYVEICYPEFDVSRAKGDGVVVRDFYSDYLFQSWLCAGIEMREEWICRDNVARRRGISVEEFTREFEEKNRPVLLEGCMDDWDAMRRWDRRYLVETCGDVRFAVGPVEMRLEDYFVYADNVREERPLYLFDPNFVKKVPILGAQYDVPVYFREDLFSVLGDERPDYRWIIIGPAGSGSSFHIDPNSTAAWNAVIKGSKKWVLFPPDVVPPGVHPSPDGAEVACPVSIIEWFMNFYAETKNWKKKPTECVCKAGEVIFVPNGWWHLVINLEESLAITQNYVCRRNLLNVLDFLKKPNASDLVSGTSDRVNLHDKFKKAIEVLCPGTIDQLLRKEEEKTANAKKLPFWEAATDSNAGAFKFSF
ncbi:hypothetical protein Droror1_Dr00008645 [Drosera rotundifolia]